MQIFRRNFLQKAPNKGLARRVQQIQAKLGGTIATSLEIDWWADLFWGNP